MSPEELEKANDELRRAGNYEERKGREVAKEETTKALEGEDAKEVKILSPKKSVEAEKAREFIKKLKGEERG